MPKHPPEQHKSDPVDPVRHKTPPTLNKSSSRLSGSEFVPLVS